MQQGPGGGGAGAGRAGRGVSSRPGPAPAAGPCAQALVLLSEAAPGVEAYSGVVARGVGACGRRALRRGSRAPKLCEGGNRGRNETAPVGPPSAACGGGGGRRRRGPSSPSQPSPRGRGLRVRPRTVRVPGVGSAEVVVARPASGRPQPGPRKVRDKSESVPRALLQGGGGGGLRASGRGRGPRWASWGSCLPAGHPACSAPAAALQQVHRARRPAASRGRLGAV